MMPASTTTADTEPEMDNILEKALKKILREQVTDQKPVRMIKTTVDTWDNEWEYYLIFCFQINFENR